MTYRVGAHSTSDDDSKYREPSAPEEGWDDERSYWEARSPIVRFGRYLHQRGCFSGADEERMRRALRKTELAIDEFGSRIVNLDKHGVPQVRAPHRVYVHGCLRRPETLLVRWT